MFKSRFFSKPEAILIYGSFLIGLIAFVALEQGNVFQFSANYKLFYLATDLLLIDFTHNFFSFAILCLYPQMASGNSSESGDTRSPRRLIFNTLMICVLAFAAISLSGKAYLDNPELQYA